MLKKPITYTDYNGVKRTEDHYFNLSKAEVMEMEITTAGGMQQMLDQIVAEMDGKRIIEVFKDIIKRSYGVKSPDGRQFIKNDEVFSKFYQSEAYSELFMELVTNGDKASAFISGILPEVPDVAANGAIENESLKQVLAQ